VQNAEESLNMATLSREMLQHAEALQQQVAFFRCAIKPVTTGQFPLRIQAAPR
jgi:methyl-accepting chemotaxis protein